MIGTKHITNKDIQDQNLFDSADNLNLYRPVLQSRYKKDTINPTDVVRAIILPIIAIIKYEMMSNTRLRLFDVLSWFIIRYAIMTRAQLKRIPAVSNVAPIPYIRCTESKKSCP